LHLRCAGAELANVANEGALECGRRGGDAITTADIYNGIDRILQVSPPFPSHGSLPPPNFKSHVGHRVYVTLMVVPDSNRGYLAHDSNFPLHKDEQIKNSMASVAYSIWSSGCAEEVQY